MASPSDLEALVGQLLPRLTTEIGATQDEVRRASEVRRICISGEERRADLHQRRGAARSGDEADAEPHRGLPLGYRNKYSGSL